jgi:hypothetical protein
VPATASRRANVPYSNVQYIFSRDVCAPMIRSAIVQGSVSWVLYNCMPNAVEIEQNVGRDDALRLMEDS